MANKLGREWMDKPQGVLTTRFGRLEVLFNSDSQVNVASYMVGQSALLTDEERTGLLYRNQRFATEMIVERVNGVWVPWRRRSNDGKRILNGEGAWAFVCRRAVGGAPAPRTYAAALKEEVLRALREYLAQPEQEQSLLLGQQAELNNQACRLEDELYKARAELREMERRHVLIMDGLETVSRVLTARARNA